MSEDEKQSETDVDYSMNWKNVFIISISAVMVVLTIIGGIVAVNKNSNDKDQKIGAACVASGGA